MRKYLWLIVILIIGALLRFFHNTDISLWHDEAFSALLIKYPWGEMMYRIGLDVHPPAYYVFLRLWHYLFGDSLLSLRSFSVFFSVGTIWAAWLFVKTAIKDNQRSALLVAALIAINPFQIQYATEARMYTMGAFFTLLAAYFLVKALEYQSQIRQIEERQIPHLPEVIQSRKKMFCSYFCFTLSIIAMIYTHYYLLFAAAAICFYGLAYLYLHHQGNFFVKFRWLLLSLAIIAIAYLPWLKIFLFQYKQVGAGYWIPPMDIWSIPSTLYTLLVGFGHDVSQNSTQGLLVIVFFLVIFIIYRFLKRTQSFHKWLVLLVVLAPFLGSLLFLLMAKLKGSGSSVYLVRYFIFTGAFLSIIVAAWISQIKLRWLFWLITASYLLLTFSAFINYWDDINIKSRPGMNKAAEYLKANMEPHHKLYAGSSFIFFNLKYYAYQINEYRKPFFWLEDINNQLNPIAVRRYQQPLLFSGGNMDIKNLPHFAGTAILTDQDLLPDFNRDVKTGDTVWLIWTNGFGASKPQVPLNWEQITENIYGEVRPYLGANVYMSEYEVK